MSELLSALDKPGPTLDTPPITSNHLNLHFSFEYGTNSRRSLSLSRPLSDSSEDMTMTGSVSDEVRKELTNTSGLPNVRGRSRAQHSRRPSTAPTTGQSISKPKGKQSSDSPFLDLSSEPRSRIRGRPSLAPAAPHPERPTTALSSDWRFKGQSTSSRTATRMPSPPTSYSQERPRVLSPTSAVLSLSDSRQDKHVVNRAMAQSARAEGLTQSLFSPSAAELSAIPMPTRPLHARRMSSLSLGGGVHHMVSTGSSMDFGKFMPQTATTSPRSASFSNVLGKSASPVDVKRLLTKPATPVGTYSAGGMPRSDDKSGNVLSSPTAPQFASDTPSSPRSGEIRPRQPFQTDSTLRSLKPRARPRTAGTADEQIANRKSTTEIQQRPSTSTSAIQSDRGRSNGLVVPRHTYSSGGEDIGESPHAKQPPQSKQNVERSSSSRPKDRTRKSAFVSTDGYLSESSIRMPKVTTALTPAAAIALAYRSQSSAGYHREVRTPDPKVAPWESDPDLPIPLPTPAPSEWGDLCTPSGFRRIGRKISMKLSGDEQPPMPPGAAARARTRSFDRPKPRELPRNTSFDTRRPNLSRPSTSGTQTSKAHTKSSSGADDSKRPITPAGGTQSGAQDITIKLHSQPPTPEVTPPVEHKRRPSFGQQIGGFVKKLSNPNLRTARKEHEAPPVPPLPNLVREKGQFETPVKGARGGNVHPVSAIPIRLAKNGPLSPEPDDKLALSASSSVDSFVAFPHGSPSTPGTTPPHVTQPKVQKSQEGKKVAEVPYTINIHSPPETPVRHTGRAKRKPEEKELRDPAAHKKPEHPVIRTSEPRISEESRELKPEPPGLTEEERQARRRTLSKAKRDKAGKLVISISEPRGLQNVTLQRSPSVAVSGASTPRPSIASMGRKSDGDVPQHQPSPQPQPQQREQQQQGSVASRKSTYTVSQAFPPTRSASLGAPTPPPSASSRPSASPLSASTSPSPGTGVNFRPMRSPANKAPLSEKQKAQLWEDLLRRSDEAGGTLQLRAIESRGKQ